MSVNKEQSGYTRASISAQALGGAVPLIDLNKKGDLQKLFASKAPASLNDSPFTKAASLNDATPRNNAPQQAQQQAAAKKEAPQQPEQVQAAEQQEPVRMQAMADNSPQNNMQAPQPPADAPSARFAFVPPQFAPVLGAGILSALHHDKAIDIAEGPDGYKQGDEFKFGSAAGRHQRRVMERIENNMEASREEGRSDSRMILMQYAAEQQRQTQQYANHMISYMDERIEAKQQDAQRLNREISELKAEQEVAVQERDAAAASVGAFSQQIEEIDSANTDLQTQAAAQREQIEDLEKKRRAVQDGIKAAQERLQKQGKEAEELAKLEQDADQASQHAGLDEKIHEINKKSNEEAIQKQKELAAQLQADIDSGKLNPEELKAKQEELKLTNSRIESWSRNQDAFARDEESSRQEKERNDERREFFRERRETLETAINDGTQVLEDMHSQHSEITIELDQRKAALEKIEEQIKANSDKKEELERQRVEAQKKLDEAQQRVDALNEQILKKTDELANVQTHLNHMTKMRKEYQALKEAKTPEEREQIQKRIDGLKSGISDDERKRFEAYDKATWDRMAAEKSAAANPQQTTAPAANSAAPSNNNTSRTNGSAAAAYDGAANKGVISGEFQSAATNTTPAAAPETPAPAPAMDDDMEYAAARQQPKPQAAGMTL